MYGKLFDNGNLIFSCAQEICQYYIDNSKKYIILIDKGQYQAGFIKKTLGVNELKVLDLEKGQYKIFNNFIFNGLQVNINGIAGFTN